MKIDIQAIRNNDKNQKDVLIGMKLLKNVMVVFSSIFLNVYIFKALNNNFELYLLGLLSAILFQQCISFVLFHVLSKKNAMIIYRCSFIFDIVLIILVLFIKSPSFPIILLFYFLQEFANACFYGPHEIGEMQHTSSKNSNKYLAKSTSITSLVKVVSPFLSGLIINQMSYAVLFIIVGIVAAIMFVLSIFMRDFAVSEGRIQLKTFCKKVFKYPHARRFYLSFTFFRLSLGGTIYTMLPVILFMKTGSEFSLGSWSSLFAVLTIVTLLAFMFVKNYKLKIILSITLLCIGCIMMTFWTSFISFIIFNVVYYMFEKLYENEIFSTRLNVIKLPEIEGYKREHHLIYDVFANFGYIIGYALILLLYKVIPSANVLSIIITAVGMLIIVSGVLLILSKNSYQNELVKLEQKQPINEEKEIVEE
jgi:MFS family permease